MGKVKKSELKKTDKDVYKIGKSFKEGMRVPAKIIASDKLLDVITKDRSLDQLVNTTFMPGVVKNTLAMPDTHEGYGCPIGGVIPIDKKKGMISPGANGFDINCGVRLIRSNVKEEDISKKINHLSQKMYEKIPSGVGSRGPLKLSKEDLKQVLEEGVSWCLKEGYGIKEDKERCEEKGKMEKAKAEKISSKAKKRGNDQLGTLGSGNHFLEIQKVDEVFNKKLSEKLGIFKNQVCIMIHCGSRGLGHQVCTDYSRKVKEELPGYNKKLPDPELAGAPFDSQLGQDYFSAMSASANFAWANRQVILHWTREVWEEVLGGKGGGELNLVYDVAHNIVKEETYEINGGNKDLIIHRKGATRAFSGQPVIIPGSMGTASHLMVGTEKAREVSFGSTAHGAGRTMSRGQAKREVWGEDLKKKLDKEGIMVKARSMPGLAEEAPVAYKDVEEVIDVTSDVDIAKKTARLKPLAVIKG